MTLPCMTGCAGESSSCRLVLSEDNVQEDGWGNMVVFSGSEKSPCVELSPSSAGCLLTQQFLVWAERG